MMNRSTPLLRPALELQYWATRTASCSPVAMPENRVSVRTDLVPTTAFGCVVLFFLFETIKCNDAVI